MQLLIETQDDDIVIATPQGQVDSSQADSFRAQLLPLFEQARVVILDGSKMDFMTSAGLRVLLSAQQKGAAPKKFVLCAINDNVREVFRVAGLDALFHYAETREQALK